MSLSYSSLFHCTAVPVRNMMKLKAKIETATNNYNKIEQNLNLFIFTKKFYLKLCLTIFTGLKTVRKSRDIYIFYLVELFYQNFNTK